MCIPGLKYGDMLAGWISNFYKYAPDDEIEATPAQQEVVEYHREKARKFVVTRDELGLGDVAEEDQNGGSDSTTASIASKDPSEIGRIIIERRKEDDEFEEDDDDDEEYEGTYTHTHIYIKRSHHLVKSVNQNK